MPNDFGSYTSTTRSNAQHQECQTVWILIRPDLGPNCLKRLSADDTSKQRVKVGLIFGKVNCHDTHRSVHKILNFWCFLLSEMSLLLPLNC